MENSDIEWIAEKASELLVDKVEDAPLDEEDIDLAYGMFAQPRLEKVLDVSPESDEFTKAENEIRVKLHEIAQELNEQHWSGEK